MIIEIDDEYTNILIDGMDCLIKNYDTYGYKMQDIPKIASLGIYFNSRAKKAVKEYVDKDEKYAKDHPEFVRGPNPDEKFVMGRGYVKPEDKK